MGVRSLLALLVLYWYKSTNTDAAHPHMLAGHTSSFGGRGGGQEWRWGGGHTIEGGGDSSPSLMTPQIAPHALPLGGGGGDIYMYIYTYILRRRRVMHV